MVKTLAVALALQLAAVTAHAAPAGGTPAAPGLPNFVQLAAIGGLPADSMVRGAFMAGFRGAFADDRFPAERRAGEGEWRESAPVFNRFRWLEGDPAEDAWKLTVVLGSPPAVVLKTRENERGHRMLETRRRSRGMIAAVTVQGPDVGQGPPPPVSERFAFAFPSNGSAVVANADSAAALIVPGVGYVFPWNDAGRIVARLALDMLHHQRGDMDADERAAIAPAVRTESGR